MPRVICDLPNASDEINGVKFHQLEDGGMISDEVTEEVAELFASIPGYAIDEEERKPVEKVVTPAPTKRGQKKAQEPVKVPESAPKADEPADDAGADAGDDEGDSGEVF